jgi:hypothetical protein
MFSLLSKPELEIFFFGLVFPVNIMDIMQKYDLQKILWKKPKSFKILYLRN